MVFNYSPFFLVFHYCSEPNSEKLEVENGHFSLSLSVFAVYREQPNTVITWIIVPPEQEQEQEPRGRSVALNWKPGGHFK